MRTAWTPRVLLQCILLILLACVFFAKSTRMVTYSRFVWERDFSGDEPKYLRTVESLRTDGDVDLSNFWGPPTEMDSPSQDDRDRNMSEDLYFEGKNGGIYPLHMPGVALLMLPAYALDARFFPSDPEHAPVHLPFLPRKMPATRLLLLGMALFSLGLFFRITGRILQSLLLAFVLTLILIFNTPFSGYSFMLYPAAAATFLSLLALNVILHPFTHRGLNLSVFAVAVGFLPWLHQRYILLSLGLFLAFFLTHWKKTGGKKTVLVACICLLLLSLPYFAYFHSLTGSASPLAPSGLHGKTYARWSTLPLGFFGNFLSRTRGFLWHYPWTALFMVGLYWGWRRDRTLTAVLILSGVLYYLISSAAIPWSGMTRPVGRYVTPVFPILLLFFGLSLQELIERFSKGRLFYYLGIVGLTVLNTRLWIIDFRFGTSYVSTADRYLILYSLVITGSLFLSLIAGERWIFKDDQRSRPTILRI